jgi:hypothetical protein
MWPARNGAEIDSSPHSGTRAKHMAMTVVIRQLTGAGPSIATVTAVGWSRVDDATGTTVIPTPTATGTNFSYVKSFMIDITATGSLSMTDVKVGKVANETTTGTKLWHRTDHAEGSYVQATAAPAATGDNNSTAPVIPAGGNNSAVTALPLIGSASVYSAGPHSTTGRKGNLVEIALGVDATNTTAGSAVATPVMRWSWTES